MTLETVSQLREETKSQLRELVTMNIDSRDGFRNGSERIDDVTIGSLCQSLAMQRQAQADELARILEMNSEDVDRDGSFSAVVHRIWTNVRESLSNDDTYSFLVEAERGEDYIKEAYETALRETAGSAMNDVLLHQYGQVKAAHDRIRTLRDEYAEDNTSGE